MRSLDQVLAPQVLLNDLIEQAIERDKQNTAQVLPCKVVAQTGYTVTVQVLVSTNKAIPALENIPILTPESLYYPVIPGSVGLLIPASVYLDLAMESGTPIDDSKTPGNLSGYTFLPLPRVGQTPINPAAVCVGTVTSPTAISATGRTVDQTALWLFLTQFQAAYNANMTALSQPTFTGTF